MIIKPTEQDTQMQKIWNDPAFIDISKAIQTYINSVPRKDLFKVHYALIGSIGIDVCSRVLFPDNILKPNRRKRK